MFKIVESYKLIDGFFKVELYPIDEEDIYYYTQLSIEFRDIKDMEMPIMLNILTQKTSKEVIIDYNHVNSAINKAIKELEFSEEFEKCLVLKNIKDKFNKEISNDHKQRVCIQSC
jgi:hypothetical protein